MSAELFGGITHRLWVCPECGCVYAHVDTPPEVIQTEALLGLPHATPQCRAHTERWPDGEFSREVNLVKTDTFIHPRITATPKGEPPVQPGESV